MRYILTEHPHIDENKNPVIVEGFEVEAPNDKEAVEEIKRRIKVEQESWGETPSEGFLAGGPYQVTGPPLVIPGYVFIWTWDYGGPVNYLWRLK